MKLLLDTHTLLWYVLADPQLSPAAKSSILDPANEIAVSAASLWELAIKVSIGKMKLHQPFQNFCDLCLNVYGFQLLAIEPKHAAVVATLPFHHKDPFDRLLIAQAIVENIPILSADATLDAYPIQRQW